MKRIFLLIGLVANFGFAQNEAAPEATAPEAAAPEEAAPAMMPQPREQFESVDNVYLPSEQQIMNTKYFQQIRNIIHKKLVNYFKKIYKYYPENSHTINRHINDILHRYYTKIIHQKIKTFSESDVEEVIQNSQIMPTTQEFLPDQVYPLVRRTCPMLNCGCR